VLTAKIERIDLARFFFCEYHPFPPYQKLMSDFRQSIGTPVGHVGRAILLAMAVVLTIGFGIATLLNPDPRGFGTHQQFGLPPCTSRLLFGVPCPGCGMTTCFAHFVRGQFADAARANPAGALLAAVCALLIPWSVWSAVRGRLWMVTDPVTVAGVMMVTIGGVTLLLWVARMSSHF